MFSLEIIEDVPLDHGNVVELESFRFPNGFPFPKSYKDFAKKYGYGLSLELFMIHIPMDDFGDSWEVRSEGIIGTYAEEIEGNNKPSFKLEPDGSLELLKAWVPFGTSENGEYLFWDVREQKNNEFDIYITDFRAAGIRKVASNLDELFEKLTDPKRFQQVLPLADDDEVCEPVFEPWEREEAEDEESAYEEDDD